jgi:lysophospholipase L1-like esterase
MKFYLKFIFILLAVAGFSFTIPPRKLRVFLIGDSTMSDKPIKAYPETGWGTMFAKFFDTSKTVVYNRAQNSQHAGAAMEVNQWAPVLDSLQQGDIVLIQFGHTAGTQTKAIRQRNKEKLTQFIEDTRSKQAIPVLITPTASFRFNTDGKMEDTYKAYSDLVRSVAEKKNVTLIELNKKSLAFIQTFGQENSRKLFNYLQPGEHPNYPEGRSDNVNFSEAGARKMAEIVYGELKIQNPGGITDYFFKPVPKK